jgi:hypothetical protein
MHCLRNYLRDEEIGHKVFKKYLQYVDSLPPRQATTIRGIDMHRHGRLYLLCTYVHMYDLTAGRSYM